MTFPVPANAGTIDIVYDPTVTLDMSGQEGDSSGAAGAASCQTAQIMMTSMMVAISLVASLLQ